ncbi:kinase domain protein, partial [Penicillium sp. IBT 31633x]
DNAKLSKRRNCDSQCSSKLCSTTEEYLCVPFFDEKARLLYEDLISNRKLGGTALFLSGEERKVFLDLVKAMLIWHSDIGETAGELARHPFLQPKQTSA